VRCTLPCFDQPPLVPPPQGIVGTTPWLALVFLTLYLQLLGMPDRVAKLLLALFLGANAAGRCPPSFRAVPPAAARTLRPLPCGAAELA